MCKFVPLGLAVEIGDYKHNSRTTAHVQFDAREKCLSYVLGLCVPNYWR